MKQFVIPPIANMELSELGDNNLFVLGQHCKNETYKSYVKKAKEPGRFIILDSGVGDHGYVLTREELLDITLELMPDEVIPTDNLYDFEKTVENCEWFIEELGKRNLLNEIKIFFCPQGKTFVEWIQCYDRGLKNPSVSTIGMSKKTIPYVIQGPDIEGDSMIGKSRNDMFEYLSDTDRLKKPLHFLGSEGPEEYKLYVQSVYGSDIVRSTDSCISVWAAMNEQKFSDAEYKRIPTPADYFDREIHSYDTYTRALVQANVELMREVLNGRIS